MLVFFVCVTLWDLLAPDCQDIHEPEKKTFTLVTLHTRGHISRVSLSAPSDDGPGSRGSSKSKHGGIIRLA